MGAAVPSPSPMRLPTPALQGPPERDTALENGLMAEEVNFDLDAAMRSYQAVISRFDDQRRIAATAIFRLGECYRKVGRLPEANAQYARIVREFSDQKRLKDLSEKQLSRDSASARLFLGSSEGLGEVAGARPPGGAPGTTPGSWPGIRGDLLNIDLAGTNKAGLAAFGFGDQDQWNGFRQPWAQKVQLDHLKLYDGTETDISLVIANCAGNWGNQTGDPMYDSYVYPNGGTGDNIVATLSGLPFGSYDCYLYGHAESGGRPEQDGIFTVEVLGGGAPPAKYGPRGCLASDGWKASEPWLESRQYVLFRNISVASGQQVVITVEPGFNGERVPASDRPAVFNGVQIMAHAQIRPRELAESGENNAASSGATVPVQSGAPRQEVAQQAALLREEIQLVQDQLAAAEKAYAAGAKPGSELNPLKRDLLALKRQLIALTAPAVKPDMLDLNSPSAASAKSILRRVELPGPETPNSSSEPARGPEALPAPTSTSQDFPIPLDEHAQLEWQLARAQLAVFKARTELANAQRNMRWAQQSSPTELPEPLASDARYRRLKSQYEELVIGDDENAKPELPQIVSKMSAWVKKIYIPEQLSAQVAAADQLRTAEKEAAELREKLQANQAGAPGTPAAVGALPPPAPERP